MKLIRIPVFLIASVFAIGCSDRVQIPYEDIKTLKIFYETKSVSSNDGYIMETVEENFINVRNRNMRQEISTLSKKGNQEFKSFRVELFMDGKHYRMNDSSPNQFIYSEYRGPKEPWKEFLSQEADKIAKETISGVECVIYETKGKETSRKLWKWNNIIIKEISEYKHGTYTKETRDLLVNPELGEDIFEIPKGAKLISREEIKKKHAAQMKKIKKRLMGEK